MDSQISDADTGAMMLIAARWAEAGMDTSRCDRYKAESAVADCYAVAGLSAPACVWFQHPVPAAIAYLTWPSASESAAVKDMTAVLIDQSDRVMEHAEDALPPGVSETVEELVYTKVHGALMGVVQTPAGEMLESVHRSESISQLIDQAHEIGSGQVAAPRRDQFAMTDDGARLRIAQAQVLNRHGTAAVIECYQMLGLDVGYALPSVELAANCFAMWPLREVALLCDRPTNISGTPNDTENHWSMQNDSTAPLEWAGDHPPAF